jgi:iron-sulfur cluster insertion protein
MLTISSEAEHEIRDFLQQEPEPIGLRVYVRGGGCHGYQ